MPDYTDPLLDIGRLLAALGQCQPTPLLNSTLSMTPELAPVQVPRVSKRISISRKEKRNAGANTSTSCSNMTSYNDSSVLFHGGLLRVAEDLLDDLMPYFDTCPPTAEIRLIGHSLGIFQTYNCCFDSSARLGKYIVWGIHNCVDQSRNHRNVVKPWLIFNYTISNSTVLD